MKNLNLIFSGACVSMLFLDLSGQSGSASMTMQHSNDQMATHNMLVVGEQTIYLSHLPMFQEKDSAVMPHRYQAILEVGFERKGGHPGAAYAKDRQAHRSTKIYTINPEPFVLPMLVSFGTQEEALQQFRGDIYRGHLEKLQNGEKKIFSAVDVQVKKVVYFQQFDTLATKPGQLEYLLFGKGKELFLTHLIVAPPDFDQMLSVTTTGGPFSDEELAKGIKIVFPNMTNSPAMRLKEKQQAAGTFDSGASSLSQKINVKVVRELYFEEGELRVPPRFGTTPEEKKTGFQ